MLYSTLEEKKFNFPDSTFTTRNGYIALSQIGTFVKEGSIGPGMGSAVSTNKILAFKKAFSEMIERRAIMAGGKGVNGFVDTWDLMNQRTARLPVSLTTYSVNSPYIIDTTGTAVHPDSKQATFTAMKELLEKNALFLFWYGKEGYHLPESDEMITDNMYYQLLTKDYAVHLFVNTHFAPLNVVMSVVYDANSLPMGGVGSSLNFREAVHQCLEETYLLKMLERINDDIQRYDRRVLREDLMQVQSSYDMYLEQLLSLDPYQGSMEDHALEPLNHGYYIDSLRNCFPDWVSELHLIYLPHFLHQKLTCVKVFSYDLYNCLPSKSNIKKNKIVYKKFEWDEKELKEIPDCPIL